jgi:3D (Asp-Asp-Asp) domain-containing protein
MYPDMEVVGHKDVSPSKCPGRYLYAWITDNYSKEESEEWNISRYYTPLIHQSDYYRKAPEDINEFYDLAVKYGVVRWNEEERYFYHNEETGSVTLSRPLANNHHDTKMMIQNDEELYWQVERDVRYFMDFTVNCQGDCSKTANEYHLKDEDAGKVAACPPEISFGTKIDLQGFGVITCVDRGSGIQGNRLDIWMGYGDEALGRIRNSSGGKRSGNIIINK